MKTLHRVAVVGGARIPFARQNTAYIERSNTEMFTAAVQGLVQRFGLEGQRLGEVAGGAALKHSRDANISREAVLSSALAPQTPAYDVQQACATSLETTVLVGNKIALGQIEVGIAGGVDSASDAPVVFGEPLRRIVLALNRARTRGDRIRALLPLRPSMLRPSIPSVDERRTGLSMGEHCELMVKQWNICRESQDLLALASHINAAKAYDSGFFDDLVVPFSGLARDNNLRADSSMEKLARLKPAFDRSSGCGTLTAGNSTPLTDGAATVLLASEAWCYTQGLEALAWLVDAEAASVDFFSPHAEGLLMAPVYAVPRLLSRNRLSLQDFDYYEIHEAFSGQVLCTLAAWANAEYCRDKLGLSAPLGAVDRNCLNVNGGSVGLGHPFAATGARIVATAAKQLALHRRATGRGGRSLISVCAAGGVGLAAILEG